MSIINHSKGFVFVHVPKAAGTSLAASLSRFNRYCDLEIGATPFGEAVAGPYLQRFSIGKHSTAFEIREVVGEAFWADSFTFAFVRHPLARTYSLYRFLKTSWRDWKGSGVMDELDTFHAFVDSDLFQTDGPDRILRPQAFWLTEDSGRRLLVDFVGKVERLREDLTVVMQRIEPGADVEQERIPWVNRSTGDADWREVYSSPAVSAKVARRYAVDFRLFGYVQEDADLSISIG